MDTSTAIRPAPKTGILLVNLGTPEAPRAPEVRRYLREFLSDPRVLDIPALGRAMLLNGVILPFRPRRSAEAYAKVWSEAGSPLLVHGLALREALAARLAPHPVALAMRYGEPSLERGLEELLAAGADAVLVFPLYPQYASSSTGSSLEAFYRAAAERWNTPFVSVVPPFFDHPGFIAAEAAVATPVLAELRPDHVLFSYHGLPVRQVRKSAPSAPACGADDAACCASLDAANRWCYRAQCYATTRALIEALQLETQQTSVAFQSRLGRTPWIQPFTDERVPALARAGVRRLAVLCPSFVADCLETLEEIGLRAAESFRAAGGEELRLVPSLNASPAWIEACERMVREVAPTLLPG